jgi:predicted transcriptional regulator
MSVTEIIQELPKLSPEDRNLLRQELDERYLQAFEETPEMLAAIDEGLRSAKEESLIPIEDVVNKIRSWNTKSP